FWRLFYPTLAAVCVLTVYGWQLVVRRRLGERALLADVSHSVWMGRYVAIAALSGGVVLFLILFTTFFKYPENPFGLYHRTLAYWMGQHAIHRIYGPFHQHMLNLAVYELPAVLLITVGVLCHLG